MMPFKSRKCRLLVLVGGVVLVLAVVSTVILVRLPRDALSNLLGSAAADAKRQTPRRITNEFGMEFVEIPPGRFVMGSTRGESDAAPHLVHITQPFFFGVTEVTGWELSEIGIAAGKWNPESHVVRRPDGERGTSIAGWEDANHLARTLSLLDPDYDYRLPTEAEWEYACRAKTDMLEPSPNDDDVVQPHSEEFGAIEPIKLKPPNAFGLYDMLRNNGEYCSDWYAADYYERSPLEDPQGPPAGRTKVVRGVRGVGSTSANDWYSYNAWYRYHANPRGDGNILLGVRFVLEKKKGNRQ